MRIALVGAEFEENLAIRYIWGALEHAGHDVRQIVFNDRTETDRAAQELVDSGAELAGFSMVFTYRAREFADLATQARLLGFRGHILAGGHFVAFNAECVLRDVPAFDSIAIGEGEEIMCDLAAHLDDLPSVQGLVWRTPAEEIVRNAPAPKPPDLDALPYPARKMPFDAFLGFPIVNMLSSRGCTHACAFCSIAAWHKLCGGARFRMRAPTAVAEEMAQLYQQGVRIFNFHDDNFLLGAQAESLARVSALKAELDRRGVGRIAFALKSRPDSVDEELFTLLKSMGLFRVFLGVEAGTAESLRKLGRGQTLDHNERALAVVNQLDLHTCFNLLLLNPDSTLEDLAANVAFLRQHPRNPMNFCRTEIYSGTPLEARLRREGRLRGDYWGYDYAIADPRAQQAFSLLYPAFRQRNYGVHALHHRTMAVDFEYQVLAHFLGGNDGLRDRVKRYVLAVNLNTCAHLEEALAAVGDGLTDGQLPAFLADLTARVEADNERLGAEGLDLLAEIREAGVSRQTAPGPSWTRKAIAAGIAASLALGSAGTRGATHVFEMAPPRTVPSPALRQEVAQKLLPRVAARLNKPVGLRLFLTLDGQGRVRFCRALTQGRQTVVLPPQDMAGILLQEAPPLRVSWEVEFTEAEVGAAREAAQRIGPAVMDPVPPPQFPPGDPVPQPPLGNPAVILDSFNTQALHVLKALVSPPRDVQIDLWLNQTGRVFHASVRAPGLAEERRARIEQFLRTMAFNVPAAFGRRFVLTVPRAALEAFGPPTHIFEMAPEPRP